MQKMRLATAMRIIGCGLCSLVSVCSMHRASQSF
jgi:hypothetical protein